MQSNFNYLCWVDQVLHQGNTITSQLNPYATHQYLIKPNFERRHLNWLLLSRFLTFMEKIEKSKKPILTVLKEAIERDVMSRTGGNMRNIM